MSMLRQSLFAFGFVFTFSKSVVLGDSFDPIEIPSPIEKVFVPNGFDDNDNVEIILHGEFRNSCYKVGKTSFTIDSEKRIINITATSYKYEGTTCLMVLTPFLQQLKIGVLKEGGYDVVVNSKLEEVVYLNIKRRITESADDYMYAPVTSASLRYSRFSREQSVEFQGTYPLMLHGCAIIDEIQVQRDMQDIIVVLPIMHIYEGEACNGHQARFKMRAVLEKPFKGEGLLHIRSINGNSYNQYLNVNP